ncbi:MULTISPECIES: FAD-binding protein [Rhizobium]|uniref:FAD-binding oxidoreductase n=1 Tax=Rhizobium changzhiense TaxID=2692317 RepID=A0A7Z0UHU0_9HYPH|nr:MULTISPECIES: FAD-binding oxidoreductase [Rhizobium]MBA5800463.1 FAD-binding oxidoreductase [Rhizobium changzhiense]MCH4547404.1 FAD-binding oxidoreductase [Rhizobium changzhiense]MCW0019084.1 FAD-binding oxidoreductase [Rhizobium sp. BT-226]NNU48871.1 FAD-binding oxidoreductase [Rhizobium changzhiense]NZD66050.1 FAD-binding oxidoreductase [Rhizobium changzhiense]
MEGWGRYPRHDSEVMDCRLPEKLSESVASRAGLIARGNGRSYGDAAIGERSTLMCSGLNRMTSFHSIDRSLTVEAGVLLSDVLRAFVPRGYFPPVVPGTKFVTIGGMVASDVHGKNHHRDGGFGDHVSELKLVVAGGEILTCSRTSNPELFFATVGGMGMTGIIAEATFALRSIESGWIAQRTIATENLGDALKALQQTEGATYSVAWIDCLSQGASLGRSLIFAGEHATLDQVGGMPEADRFSVRNAAKISLPFDLPQWALNRTSIAAFNELYFRAGTRKSAQTSLVHWDKYFFPLDGILEWNRLYGRRGFLQHQCVVPARDALPVLSGILERFARSGKGSFLAVLKKLGASSGMLSFPMPGYTLALDLPVTQGVFRLLDEIDELVVKAGGRLYLAKDARQSRHTFEAGYPRLNAFKELRKVTGADRHFESRLAMRLGI